MQIVQNFKKTLTLDLRSLALMRISVGLIILWDLIQRVFFIKEFYTDAGILPRTITLRQPFPSFNNLSGEINLQIFLFCILFLLSLCLIFGFKTKVTTPLLMIFLVSLNNRNKLILFGFDILMISVLFWGSLLPWDKKFTIFKNKKDNQYTKFVGIATFGYILQIIYLYTFSAFGKTNAVWIPEGLATYYSITIAMPYKILAQTLLNFPFVLKLITYVTYFAELLIPPLLLLPKKQQLFRYIVITTFIMLHLGLYFSLRVGLFPLLGISMLFGIIPSSFWNKLNKQNNSKNLKKLNNTLLASKTYNYISIVACVIIFILNIHNLDPLLPKNIEQIVNISGLEQSWNMYSYPGSTAKTPVIKLINKNNSITLMREDFNLKIPFSTGRWQQYLDSYDSKIYEPYRISFTNYLCEEYKNTNKVIVEYLYQDFNIVNPKNYSRTILDYQCLN